MIFFSFCIWWYFQNSVNMWNVFSFEWETNDFFPSSTCISDDWCERKKKKVHNFRKKKSHNMFSNVFFRTFSALYVTEYRDFLVHNFFFCTSDGVMMLFGRKIQKRRYLSWLDHGIFEDWEKFRIKAWKSTKLLRKECSKIFM